jgi:hypothetical protein
VSGALFVDTERQCYKWHPGLDVNDTENRPFRGAQLDRRTAASGDGSDQEFELDTIPVAGSHVAPPPVAPGVVAR